MALLRYGHRMSESAQLSWVDGTEAVCVTVASDLDREAFQRTLLSVGTEFAGSREQVLAWVGASPNLDRVWCALGTVDGHVFAWEANGWLGADPQMTVRLSADGACASVFWNVNMDSSFSYARAGELVRHFDPVLGAGADGTHTLAEEPGLDWANEPLRSAIRLQARLMGCPLASPEWLDLPGVTFFGRTF